MTTRESSLVRVHLVLPVADMTAAREWYARALGFETVYLHGDPVEDPAENYAVLRRDGAEVHLILDEPPRPHPWLTPGTGYLYLVVRGLDALYGAANANGIAIAREIEMETWGVRAFQLTDPSGNLILVAEEG